MSNKNLTTFYIGVTNDLERRVNEQFDILHEANGAEPAISNHDKK